MSDIIAEAFAMQEAKCSEDEAHYALAIMFAKDVNDAVAALRAYGDLRVTLERMADAGRHDPLPPARWETFHHVVRRPWCWVVGHNPAHNHYRCARCWRPG